MKWKHWLTYPLDLHQARQQLLRPEGLPEELTAPAIVLDLDTDEMLIDCARHLGCLAAHAAKIHSPLVLRCEKRLLAAIAHKKLGKFFLSFPNVKWISQGTRVPDGSLVLCDHPSQSRSIRMLIGCDSVPGIPVMPYPMHPKQISGFTQQRCDTLRGKPKAGIFFAGNQKARYGRMAMQSRFGILPRREILTVLKEAFPDRLEPRDSGLDPTRIVLRDSATDPIAGTDWLNVLASHQFFLCCPGAAQPVCHNVIEAMACGVIPIIEYADRMHPELEDGVNAITFDGRDGLLHAIERIDRMTRRERGRLSQGVTNYYDQHLDGAAFLKRARDKHTLKRFGAVMMPYHDHDLSMASQLRAA